jgi:hypothetical protein
VDNRGLDIQGRFHLSTREIFCNIVVEELDEDKDMEEWKKLEKDARYHSKHSITHFVAYDLMKACRGKQK